MHSKVAVFRMKKDMPKDFDFKEAVSHEDYFGVLQRKFDADYCTMLNISQEEFEGLGWFSEFKTGENEYTFSAEKLLSIRQKTLNYIIDEVKKVDGKIDKLKKYEWSMFLWHLKNPNWVESFEVIIIDDVDYIWTVDRVNEIDEIDEPCCYVGMIDYHF